MQGGDICVLVREYSQAEVFGPRLPWSFWRQWRDDVITRDVEWNRRINPHGQSLESWMRTTNYVGRIDPSFLKNFSESRRTGINWDVVKTL